MQILENIQAYLQVTSRHLNTDFYSDICVSTALFSPKYEHDFKKFIQNSHKDVISHQVIRYFGNRFDSATEVNTALWRRIYY